MDLSFLRALFGSLFVYLLSVGLVRDLRQSGSGRQAESRAQRLFGPVGPRQIASGVKSGLTSGLESRVGVGEQFPGWNLMVRLSARLQERNVEMRPALLPLFAAIFVLLGMMATNLFLYNFWIGLPITLGLELALGAHLLRGQEKADPSAFSRQLPRALGLVSSSLRVQPSLLKALEDALPGLDGAAKAQFQIVVSEVVGGIPMEDALNHLARRVEHPDVQMAVTAINMVAPMSGQQIAGVLADLAAVTQKRASLSRRIANLMVQQRTSGMILALMGPGFIVITLLMGPEYVGGLVSTVDGRWMLVLTTIWYLIGWAIMRALIRVRI